MQASTLQLVVGLALLGAAPAAAQTVPWLVPAPLRVHVEAERFQLVTAVRGLPLGVREELQRLFGSSAMAIADPDAPFQAAEGVADLSLSIRRLRVAGCSQDHCLVYYERGGSTHTWHAVLFHWTPDRTRVEAGGIAPAGFRTVDELRKALLSGALSGPARTW